MTSMIRPLLGIAALAVAVILLGAAALAVRDEAAPDAKALYDLYGACLDLADRDPSKAIDRAFAWEAKGGAALARHCLAVGLFTLGRFDIAGERLDALARAVEDGQAMPFVDGKRIAAEAHLVAELYRQAAEAWLLAGQLRSAEASIDDAISLTSDGSPDLSGLLLDRARIAAADGDWGLAVSDLERARTMDPLRADIVLFLASAARQLGDERVAERSINQYLKVADDDPAGHLELGNLRDMQGRVDEARRAWLTVLQLEEDGPNAEAARANLARIDLKTEP